MRLPGLLFADGGRILGGQLLRNASGETLDLMDEERIREVADYTVRLRYQGHSTEEQQAMARLAAGLLPAAIVARFAATVRTGDRAGAFTLFSAHDNTMVALLAQLGASGKGS